MKIGQGTRRVEDKRFLSGTGLYLDDISSGDMVFGATLYSPHARARIKAIDVVEAENSNGVLAVYTSAKLSSSHISPIIARNIINNRDGTPSANPPRQILADSEVRFVGDAVAFVVAETFPLAKRATELIKVEYEILPAVTDPIAALKAEAPLVWADVPGNVCLDFSAGDNSAVDAAFARAAHITSLDLINQRVSVTPIEPRGAIGEFDTENQSFTLIASTQNIHAHRNELANNIFGVPLENMRVIATDIGGGFGTKNSIYPEYALVLLAARDIGRSVKWIADRSESFLTDNDGRDQWSRVELAVDENQNFTGFRVTSVGGAGAYLANNTAGIPTEGTVRTLGGHYKIGARFFQCKVAFTNTCPTDPYRGAGRPEATYQIERVIDVAADELGVDRIELRRRNVVQLKDIPYDNGLGHIFDSGDFPNLLNRAVSISNWSGRTGQNLSGDRELRGVGMCFWLAPTGGPSKEYAALRFSADGSVMLAVGSQSAGMGHETSLPQLVSSWLGVPYEAITYRQGDTTLTPFGGGHSGSRTLGMTGSAIKIVTDRVISKATEIAGKILEVSPVDLQFSSGKFSVVGTDRSITMTEIICASFDKSFLTNGFSGGLDDEEIYERSWISYPNGCHVAEVIIDSSTGIIRVIKYFAVEDAGPVVNPMLAEGQVMGGIAQGVGQALLEGVRYEPETGQLLTGSLMDYCIPRADNSPVPKIIDRSA